MAPEHMWLVSDAILSSKPPLPRLKGDANHAGMTDGLGGGEGAGKGHAAVPLGATKLSALGSDEESMCLFCF